MKIRIFSIYFYHYRIFEKFERANFFPSRIYLISKINVDEFGTRLNGGEP